MINSSLFTEVRDKGIPRFELYTYEWQEWWSEQRDRCINGYSAGGKFMTGKLYFYVNFWKIERQNITGERKTRGYPDLRDVEWEFFPLFNQAKKEHKGIIIVTGRGMGKSFITSSWIGHEFSFYSDNEIVVSSGDSKYSNDLMKKLKIGIENLPFEFSHNLIKKDYNKEVRSGYIVKDKKTNQHKQLGYNSRVYNITYQDNPMASNGKRPSLHIFEEAGTQDNLLESYNSSIECWMDGSVQFGVPVIIGTGGDMEKSTVGFQQMFYDPDTYNLIGFEDEWDLSGGKVGYFIPGYKGLNQFKDENGYTDIDPAKKYLEGRRELKRHGKNKEAYYQELQYQPFTPKEAFLITSGNIFNKELINQQILKLKTDKQLRNLITTGNIEWIVQDGKTTGDVRFIPDPLGCYQIAEQPIEGAPFGLYVGGNDPYDHDEAHTSVSLGSTFIFKRFRGDEDTGHFLVAEYTDRPDKVDDLYEGILKLLIFYNARLLYENEKKGLYTWFHHKNKDHYLLDQPGLIKDITPTSKVNRMKGIHMSVPIKNYLEIQVKDYIEGHCHQIYFLDLLEELIRYNDEGNFDRVIAFGLCLIHVQEIFRVQVKERELNSHKFGSYQLVGGKVRWMGNEITDSRILI